MFLLMTLAQARPFEDPSTNLDAAFLMGPGELTHTLGVRMSGERNGYASLVSRTQVSGDWVLRADAGMDLLPRRERVDLFLGAAMAGAGDWRDRAVYGQLGAGLELGAALNIRELHLRYMRVQPFARSEVCRGLDESEWRLSWDVNEHLGIYGNSVRLYPDLELDEALHAYGMGATWTF